MKKIFFVFAVTATFALVSCGNSTTDKKPISDSIVKPVAKSTTDSLLNMANQTAKGDSLNSKTSVDSSKAQKK